MPNVIDDLEEKLKVYRGALGDITKELAQKRTEMSTLAKQTVDQLDASIPVLRQKAAAAQTELSRLEALIEEKKTKYETEYRSCTARFQELENRLKEDYLKKLKSLDARERTHSAAESQLRARIESHKRNEERLNARIHDFETTSMEASKALSRDRKDLETRITNLQVNTLKEHNEFESYKEKTIKDLEAREKKAQVLLETNESLNQAIRVKHNEATSQLETLKAKTKEADAVLARIAEVQQILDTAQAKEDAVNKRKDELNSLALKLKVGLDDVAKKKKELSQLEKILTDRENNIKIVEAKLQESIK